MLRSTRFTIGIFLLLFAIAIPWYWRFLPATAVRVIWGVPCWVLVSLLGSLAISAFTALTLLTSWPADEEEGHE